MNRLKKSYSMAKFACVKNEGQGLRDRPAFVAMDDGTGAPVPLTAQRLSVSGKFEFLDRILPRLVQFDHKVLIFAQMTSSLDLLQKMLERLGLPFTRIDGSKSLRQRSIAITAFQREPHVRVMLLTTRAGGLGLNLQVADTVIIFDCDWNPQADLQATDRAHRIGQTSDDAAQRQRGAAERAGQLPGAAAGQSHRILPGLHSAELRAAIAYRLLRHAVLSFAQLTTALERAREGTPRSLLGNQVARRLSGMVHSLHCESGTVLFRQGDPPGNCYVILEGRVGGSAENGSGSRVAWNVVWDKHAVMHFKEVKPDEETQPDIDSREGTPRDGPPLRMQRETTGEGPFSDALSDSSDDRDSNPFRRPENESRRSSAARSALNSSMDIASRRSSVKSGRRVSYERQSSSNLEEEPMSRRTSLEWTESKGSGEMNASIQDERPRQSRRRGPSGTMWQSKAFTWKEESFSVSHPNSRFGTQVVQLTRGQLFGELALMGDQPRAGSAQCLEDTQFLDFDSLLKSDLGKQKDETTGFLRRHVPGMADLPEQSRFGKPHASYYFKHQSHCSTQEKLWVLRRGVVEFWHLDPEAGGKLRPSSKQGARPRGRRIALLVEGGLFSAVPTNDLEPFTVVAQSLCEVFCVVKGDLKHLPYRVMTAIQDTPRQHITLSASVPQKPPKARESFGCFAS
eukprot:g29607.t1